MWPSVTCPYRGGVKKSWNSCDVIYGWPIRYTRLKCTNNNMFTNYFLLHNVWNKVYVSWYYLKHAISVWTCKQDFICDVSVKPTIWKLRVRMFPCHKNASVTWWKRRSGIKGFVRPGCKCDKHVPCDLVDISSINLLFSH